MTLFVILWVDFAFLGCMARENFLSTVFYRLNWSFVALFLISAFYFYIIYFLKERNKYKILEKLILFFGLGLSFFSIFTDFIIKESVIQPWGAEIIFGYGNILFNLYSLFVAFVVVGLLIKKYFQFDKKQKLKIQYFLIGTFLFVSFNIIFNIIIPVVSGSVQYQHFGDYSAIFLLGFTAYAIIKRQFFGIRVILTEIAVGAIAILLLANIIGAKTFFEYVWRGTLFIIFLILGHLLIKSILDEIKRRKQLEDLMKQLAKANRKLKQLDRAKSEFISIASHQLRTPLGAIKGFVSLLLEGSYGEVNEKAKEALKKISTSNERLIVLVDDLLHLSRIEAGKMQYDFDCWQIEDIVQEIKDTLLLKAKEKGLYLKVNSPSPPLPKIRIDGAKIKEVISNLVENAVKYTNRGGVKVGFKQEENLIRIIVSDTGVGISQDEMVRLFSKFSRGKNISRLNADGAGLGLFVGRKIVEAHKGKIWAESEGKGKGSRFIVEIPINLNELKKEKERRKVQSREVKKFIKEI